MILLSKKCKEEKILTFFSPSSPMSPHTLIHRKKKCVLEANACLTKHYTLSTYCKRWDVVGVSMNRYFSSSFSPLFTIQLGRFVSENNAMRWVLHNYTFILYLPFRAADQQLKPNFISYDSIEISLLFVVLDSLERNKVGWNKSVELSCSQERVINFEIFRCSFLKYCSSKNWFLI